ncbi:CamS family sex pheromone protein [Bacillaceae bacterium W0354]
MKKTLIFLSSLVIILSGCAPKFNSEDEVIQEPKEDSEKEQRFIVPQRISDEEYRTMLPYEVSAARGIITNQVSNRYDIDELEQGLIRHASTVFDPEKYFFQEGQYLNDKTLLTWIDDLNPKKVSQVLDDDATVQEHRQYHEENPRILSHILEQNYLVLAEENKVELGGVAIGIALKSELAYTTEIGGPTYYLDINKEEMLEFGKETANKVLERLRNIKALNDVPILIMLYEQNANNAIVPGNFIAKTVAQPQTMLVGEWTTINEEYVLFPSKRAETEYYDHSEMMRDFTNDVTEFFPNYVGVIGNGFYIDGNLQQLSINIPVEFHGKQEVVGFVQHLYGLVTEHFPNYFDVQIIVESLRREEGIVIRKAGEEQPFVHIYQ